MWGPGTSELPSTVSSVVRSRLFFSRLNAVDDILTQERVNKSSLFGIGEYGENLVWPADYSLVVLLTARNVVPTPLLSPCLRSQFHLSPKSRVNNAAADPPVIPPSRKHVRTDRRDLGEGVNRPGSPGEVHADSHQGFLR